MNFEGQYLKKYLFPCRGKHTIIISESGSTSIQSLGAKECHRYTAFDPKRCFISLRYSSAAGLLLLSALNVIDGDLGTYP